MLIISEQVLKAADVGADLIGKIEKGIPEDDPRNAAVIADLVGDNVGDCAGMAADVFESYEVTLVAAIILAAAALLDQSFKNHYADQASSFALKLILFPLLVRAVGIFSSIVGIWNVRMRGGAGQDPMRPIAVGYWVAGLVSIIGIAVINYFYLVDPKTGNPDFRFFLATTMGIVLALVTLWITNTFTHPDKAAATETAVSTKTGAATMLLTGMGAGMESTVWAILAIAGTIVVACLILIGIAVAFSKRGSIAAKAE